MFEYFYSRQHNMLNCTKLTIYVLFHHVLFKSKQAVTSGDIYNSTFIGNVSSQYDYFHLYNSWDPSTAFQPGSRFSGSMNVDMSDIGTNLIPFPKMHFISSGISPVTVSVDKLKAHNSSVKLKNEVFINSCNKKNQLQRLDPLGLNSTVLGSCLIGRGDFTVADMRSYVEKLQTKAHFTPWSRKSIRTGLCEVPPTGHNTSMLSMFNTTVMQNLFIDILDQFYKLYNKKAHLHHYTKVEGFEKMYFDECQESLLTILNNYKSINAVNIKKPRYKVI